MALAAGLVWVAATAAATGVPRPPARVVGAAPSVVEILGALGLESRLVGVCAQCDHPPGVRGLPTVGSYVTPSVEAVVALEPDLLLVVPSPGNREAVRQIERLGIETLVVRDRTLADLLDAIDLVAGRFGERARGAALRDRITGELDEVRRSVAGRSRPRVLLVVGHRPLVVAGGGTLQDELIEIAGGENMGRPLGATWPVLSLEVLARDPPDVVVDAAMGTEAGARSALEPATGTGIGPRVVRIPIDEMMRAGPRVADAARHLARAIHPEGAE